MRDAAQHTFQKTQALVFDRYYNGHFALYFVEPFVGYLLNDMEWVAKCFVYFQAAIQFVYALHGMEVVGAEALEVVR